MNGLIAAQNKDGLILSDNGKAEGKIIVHKATVFGQALSQDQGINRNTVIISQTPSVMVQPSAPPLVISNPTVISSMASMSINESIRPIPLPLSSAFTMNRPTFIDYILGGCEISLSVAIDFTGSNGDPRTPGTLHHQANGVKNDYEKAILAIGNILSKFDSDQKFPVW